MARSLDFHRPRQPQPRPARSRRQPAAITAVVVLVGILIIASAVGTHFGAAQTPPAPVSPSSATVSSSLLPNQTASTGGSSLGPSPTTTPTISSLPIPSDTPTSSPATPTSSPAPSSPPPTFVKQSISMEILNGSGTAGQASSARQRITAKGWSVRYIAVAATRRASTVIYYRTGKEQAAQQLANDLSDQSVTLTRNDTLVGKDDILVIIGTDWS